MDKTLPYFDIIMRRGMHHKIKEYPLPEGYRFTAYKDGDEQHWIDLEVGVGGFDTAKEAADYFEHVFLSHKEELYHRMYFILDPNGKYVATTTAWYKDDATRHYAVLHWVCVDESQHGKGLGNCMVAHVFSKFPEVEPKENEIFLHTQTWSYPAVKMYYKMGFRITDVPLIDCHTDYNAMQVLSNVLPKEIVDDLLEK